MALAVCESNSCASLVLTRALDRGPSNNAVLYITLLFFAACMEVSVYAMLKLGNKRREL